MKNPRTRPSTLDNPIIDMMPRIVMWWPSLPPAPIGYSKSPGIVPIPGTRKLERLEENLGAVDLELTAEDLLEIEGAFSKKNVVWWLSLWGHFLKLAFPRRRNS